MQSQSMQSSKYKKTKTQNLGSPTKQKEVAPEDNWNLVANPSVYMDPLPQPYRFLHKCLDKLIMKPVYNQITIIEERRKTPEYEGNIKEV